MTSLSRIPLLALFSATLLAQDAPPTKAKPAIIKGGYGVSTEVPELPPVQPGPVYLTCGPMLGHVSHDEANLWIKGSGAAEKVRVYLSTGADMAGAREVGAARLREDSAFTNSIKISGLKPATRYFYRVELNDAPVMARPWPSFVTAPEPGSKGRQRIVFGSCVGKEPWLDAGTWADVGGQARPDLVLLLGDNHYANTTDLDSQRAAYQSHRSTASFRALFAQTPLYTTWDDHDYGPNDSDGTLPGKEDSLRAFKEFNASPAYGLPDNPGVYYRFTRGDVDVFMLDGRYYRSPDKAADDGTKTMLGAAQLAWLKRELEASKATIKIIANGSEFQSHGVTDSWTSFARERDELFAFIEEKKIGGIVLLSGDRHFSAGYQVKGKWLEFSSGPLGSPNSTIKATPEMFMGFDRAKMYSVLEVDTTGEQPMLKIQIVEPGSGTVGQRSFTWDEISGAAKIPALPADFKTTGAKSAKLPPVAGPGPKKKP